MSHSCASELDGKSDSLAEKLAENCKQLKIDGEVLDRVLSELVRTISQHSLEMKNTATVKETVLYFPLLLLRFQLEKCCVAATLLDFFDHMRKFLQMVKLRPRVADRVLLMENKFAIAAVLFKKYRALFPDIFIVSFGNTPEKQFRSGVSSRSKLREAMELTPKGVFQFCWSIFVCLKGTMESFSDDLVNAMHLLVCCVDFCCSNLLFAKRTDLLSASLLGILQSSGNVFDETIQEKHEWLKSPLILDYVCEKHSIATSLEARRVRTYCFHPKMKSLFDKNLLFCSTPLSGYLNKENFEKNMKALTELYGEMLSSTCEIDERLFLSDDGGANEIGTPRKGPRPPTTSNGNDLPPIDPDFLLRKNVQACLEMVKPPQRPATPLTASQYLSQVHKESAFSPVTPVSKATHALLVLQELLDGCTPSPNLSLLEIFRSCKENPEQQITERVKLMSDSVLSAFKAEENVRYFVAANQVGVCSYSFTGPENWCFSDLQSHLQKAAAFYFRMLERILALEKNRVPTLGDFSLILSQDLFHRCLFACSLDVVLFSYSLSSPFGRILDALGIHPFHCYKIIELFVRAEPTFSRHVVRRMNHLEERVLEETAWDCASPLWALLEKEGVPACEEVMLPSQMTPRPFYAGIQDTPLGVAGRFDPVLITSSAKRRLDFETTDSSASCASPEKRLALEPQPPATSPAPSGLSLIRVTPITLPCPSFSSGSSTSAAVAGATLVADVSDKSDECTTKSPSCSETKRTGSLALFFRKVYSLAHVRLKDLCERLNVGSCNLQQLTWTLFEHVMQKRTTLLKSRHIDQILMCSLYIMAKVSSKDKSFQDILRAYRLQPQASSSVYRDVLLGCFVNSSSATSTTVTDLESGECPESTDKNEIAKETKQHQLRSPSRMPAPAITSPPPIPSPTCEEERGDLIKFYNQVFVSSLEEFVLKFAPQPLSSISDTPERIIENTDVPLSPLPLARSNPVSPRKQVAQRIFVSSLKPNSMPLSPYRSLTYSFNRSPAKDLKVINSILVGRERYVRPNLSSSETMPASSSSNAGIMSVSPKPVIRTHAASVLRRSKPLNLFGGATLQQRIAPQCRTVEEVMRIQRSVIPGQQQHQRPLSVGAGSSSRSTTVTLDDDEDSRLSDEGSSLQSEEDAKIIAASVKSKP